MRNNNHLALIGYLAATGALPMPKSENKVEPKNKHNLSENEIEQMQSMNPKEKKRFLKDRK